MRATLQTQAPARLYVPVLSDAWWRDLFLRQLEAQGFGRLAARDGDQDVLELYPLEGGPGATLEIRRPRCYRRVFLGGSVGAAEAYMDGDWDSPELTGVIRVAARCQQLWNAVNTPWAAGYRLALRALARFARNTRTGSRKNIAAHYDLGNEFFSLFLDETLTYSAAYFPAPETSLAEASTAKLDLLCRKLALKSTDHVLEIGSGWGSFALHAAQHYGCRVTTTTISRRQHELARQRVREAGLEERVTVLLSDYRDLEGTYDKIVSIEMIEAVGHEYLPTYFEVCSTRLKPEGVLALQAICSPDQDYDRYRREVDFIKQYIFPGGCLTSSAAMLHAVKSGSDLQLYALEDLSPHYARTLLHWRENFVRRREEVLALGFDERFLRMWEFYLTSCAGAFHTGICDVTQITLRRPA